MAMDEFWTWLGTGLVVAFAAVVAIVSLSGGDVVTGALLASVGVMIAVLVASTYQTISGLLTRRARAQKLED